MPTLEGGRRAGFGATSRCQVISKLRRREYELRLMQLRAAQRYWEKQAEAGQQES